MKYRILSGNKWDEQNIYIYIYIYIKSHIILIFWVENTIKISYGFKRIQEVGRLGDWR